MMFSNQTNICTMKALNWIAVTSVAVGALFILTGILSGLLGINFMGSYTINFFLAADSFFLLAIALFFFALMHQRGKGSF